MPRPVEGTSPYSPGLDGIRAIAVLAVVAYHLDLGWARGGLLGVGVFFVLSGYLITDLLVSEYRRRSTLQLRQFWLRRARRLLPALFVMLVVTVAWATLFDRGQLPGLRSDMLPAIFYFSNWWYIFHHVSYFSQYGPPSPLGHLWSLAIEEQFYLVWPVVLLAALRWARGRRALIAGALLLAAASAIEMAVLYSPVSDPTRVYDGTDTRAFELLIGAALAFAWPRNASFRPITRGARRLLETVGAAALVGILLLYWLTAQFDPFVYRGGMVLLSVCTALVIAVCVHPGTRLGAVLGVAPLRWVGERSYGMYLWQVPVIVLTTPYGAHASALRDVAQLAAILVLSALSWRFVEQPIRHGALGRAWDRMRRGEWSSLRPGGQGWAVAAPVLVGGVVCVLGLSGAISGAAPNAREVVKSILPPKHHVDPPKTSPSTSPTTTRGTTVGSPPTTTAPPPAGEGVTAIGDSVMVDAAPYLEQMLPGIVIDAQVGQQLTQVQAAVPQLEHDGDIGNRLILELGTNGYYSVTQLETLLRSLGPMRHVVLVNTRETRPWEQAVNQTIATVARSWPDTTLVDWYDDSAAYPQYFYPDGVHLDPQGAQYYATLIVRALEAPLPGAVATSPASTPRIQAVADRRSGAPVPRVAGGAPAG
jgi:peptidoglycan/LPS O-acetylase OafA/YrhL